MAARIVPVNDKSLKPDEKRWAAQYLRDRAVPLDWAAKCGVGINIVGGRDDRGRSGAIAFRYFDLDGGPTDFVRYRTKEGFDQDPKTGVHVYVPPWVKSGKRSASMSRTLADVRHALLMSEGETRALSLTSREHPAIAIPGLDCWHQKGEHELCDDLQGITWQDSGDRRRLIWLPDADVWRRPDLQTKSMEMGRALEARGAEFLIGRVPEIDGDPKSGIDDFLAAKGTTVRDLRKLLEDARPLNHPDLASWGDDGVSLNLDFRTLGERKWIEQEPPPLEFTWQDYLPRGTVALLVAVGGAGKTFLAQGLAQSIASGRPFLGRAVRQGKVVHIACEETDNELWRRNYRLHEHAAKDASESQRSKLAKSINGNLHPVSAVGQELFLVTARDFGIAQGRALDVLIFTLKQLGGVELLILDPLSRLHNLPDENQAWGTSIINAAERVAQEVGCTVLVTHHTGKNTTRKDLYAARGSSALADAARAELILMLASEDDCDGFTNIDPSDVAAGRVLQLINSKMSYAERQPTIWLQRGEDGIIGTIEPKGRQRLRELYDWWVEQHKREPFYEKTVKRKCKAIFGDAMSWRKAVQILNRGVQTGRIKVAPETGTRGKAYTFADEYEGEFRS